MRFIIFIFLFISINCSFFSFFSDKCGYNSHPLERLNEILDNNLLEQEDAKNDIKNKIKEWYEKRNKYFLFIL